MELKRKCRKHDQSCKGKGCCITTSNNIGIGTLYLIKPLHLTGCPARRAVDQSITLN